MNIISFLNVHTDIIYGLFLYIAIHVVMINLQSKQSIRQILLVLNPLMWNLHTRKKCVVMDKPL